jgi:hypothetical protein
MDRHAQGILLIILSVIAYSSAGCFTRMIHLNAWTILARTVRRSDDHLRHRHSRATQPWGAFERSVVLASHKLDGSISVARPKIAAH